MRIIIESEPNTGTFSEPTRISHYSSSEKSENREERNNNKWSTLINVLLSLGIASLILIVSYLFIKDSGSFKEVKKVLPELNKIEEKKILYSRATLAIAMAETEFDNRYFAGPKVDRDNNLFSFVVTTKEKGEKQEKKIPLKFKNRDECYDHYKKVQATLISEAERLNQSLGTDEEYIFLYYEIPNNSIQQSADKAKKALLNLTLLSAVIDSKAAQKGIMKTTKQWFTNF